MSDKNPAKNSHKYLMGHLKYELVGILFNNELHTKYITSCNILVFV